MDQDAVGTVPAATQLGKLACTVCAYVVQTKATCKLCGRTLTPELIADSKAQLEEMKGRQP